MKKIILFLLLSFSFHGFSQTPSEYAVVKVTNNFPGEVYYYQMVLGLDQNGVINGLFLDTYDLNSGAKTYRKTFDVKSLNGDFVLDEREGIRTIILRFGQFTHALGGEITIRYLRNVLIGAYDKIHLQLSPTLTTLQSPWTLKEKETKIEKMHFSVKKKFGSVVGIEEVLYNQLLD
jgi:hypothetical protein